MRFLFFKAYKLLNLPCWASEVSRVQSRFRVIYTYMYVGRFVYDCLWETHTKKWYAKMRGRNYMVQTHASSKSVL